MPYKLTKSGDGEKVTSPNHPRGFSKEPQSHEMARKQMVAIMLNSGEGKKGEKVAPKVGVRKK